MRISNARRLVVGVVVIAFGFVLTFVLSAGVTERTEPPPLFYIMPREDQSLRQGTFSEPELYIWPHPTLGYCINIAIDVDENPTTNFVVGLPSDARILKVQASGFSVRDQSVPRGDECYPGGLFEWTDESGQPESGPLRARLLKAQEAKSGRRWLEISDKTVNSVGRLLKDQISVNRDFPYPPGGPVTFMVTAVTRAPLIQGTASQSPSTPSHRPRLATIYPLVSMSYGSIHKMMA